MWEQEDPDVDGAPGDLVAEDLQPASTAPPSRANSLARVVQDPALELGPAVLPSGAPNQSATTQKSPQQQTEGPPPQYPDPCSGISAVRRWVEGPPPVCGGRAAE